ncbi:protein-glutamate O-methyltransferase CheR (plasmid) [Pontibacillus sp. ALD_SL1]|uniref:CheR family methyltransferase n=1 Tax=Pontibacillus sp. ALD_SL1 TaxID=2777185 RepID=UPI001A973C66|nr:protein-glutamate O-methyltransferase CheR [Pontibacillus sp. ALD_SL1]QST02069.1 protein-glutamate O-methyltransferase CheR [Pontibacillus sp. ALD_SL1]
MCGDYQIFVKKVYKHVGIDLNNYKRDQMERRVKSLFIKKGFQTFDDYLDAIVKDPKVYKEFLERITINVTEFFRNEKHWRTLQEVVLPGILDRNKVFKCWSAACSTGEEAYSLVMTINQFLPLEYIKVYATDIDESVLEKARQGVYSEKGMKNCGDRFRRKYFRKREDGDYEVLPEVKRCVTFRQSDLLKEEDFKKEEWELIVCRNVMIYFKEEAKKDLYNGFHRSLKPDGYLFVGSTEQIFHPSRYGFKAEQSFFYKKVSRRG